MSKFTPGPWHRNIAPATKYNTIFAGRNTHICHLTVTGIPPDQVEANCNLIAAAPDLYATLALINACQADEHGAVTLGHGEMTTIRIVLAKARGES